MSIRVARPFHAELHYDVLSHLDLGRDAASIYRERPDLVPPPDWIEPLRAAYLGTPHRLWVQWLPLVSRDIADLFVPLQRPPERLRDAAGRALCDALARALEERAAAAYEAWRAAGPAGALDTARLQTLREALWAPRMPPPLIVMDTHALGPYGRGATLKDGTRVVATSLAEPGAHAFLQVLHEETHPVSDPEVLAPGATAGRDTRAGTSGYAAHQALEERALEVGLQLLSRHAPDLLPHYARWQARWGGTRAAG